MANDLELAQEELARLMAAHNRWSAKVAQLQLTAAALDGGEALQAALQQLQTELQQALRDRQEALSAAAEWEQKAREIGRQIAAERLAKGRELLALRQRIAELERNAIKNGPPG